MSDPIRVKRITYIHPSGMVIFHDPDTDTWTEEYPESPEPSFWTSERYGIFLLICSLVIAVLLGYWWGS